MKVLPFEQSSRPAPADAVSPAKESEKPDVDPSRKHAAPDDGHGHDEPGYGHGV